MRSRRILSVVAVVVTAIAAAWPAAAEPTVDLAGRLDRAVQARMAELGIPGAVVGLSVPGEIDYVRAFGVGDIATTAPMQVADHSRIGSVTKTFTGTAILQLVDQGRVSLTDPISKYVDGVPAGDQITLDMLGRMRSGLADFVDEAFVDRLFDQSPAGPQAFPSTPRASLDAALHQPLVFAPDTDYRYCNTNFVLLGLVVETVTGVPFGDYLQHNVFDPLGLTDSSFPTDGVMPEPYAHGYTDAADGRRVDTASWNPSWGFAAGGIVSTVSDLLRWAPALGEGTLLAPGTQAQRLSGGTEATPGVNYRFALVDAQGWLGHSGDIPGYTTVVFYLPEKDATLVVLANTDTTDLSAAGRIADALTTVATPDDVLSSVQVRRS